MCADVTVYTTGAAGTYSLMMRIASSRCTSMT